MVLLSYLARGTQADLGRAALLANGFVYVQEHDRYYDDGRLRNAYQGGDLILPPGWIPNNRKNTARLPGWWDVGQKKWLEDHAQVGSDTGNIAWAAIALLRSYNILGKPEYLKAARRLATWIWRHTLDVNGPSGYTGGYEGWEPAPTKRTWKSTEHNIDVYVAFMTLSDFSDQSRRERWRRRALHAKRFVESMWGACGADHFATGTGNDGVSPNCTFAPADVNTWGLMALGKVRTYGAGVTWVQANTQHMEPCFGGGTAIGFDFNDDRDGIWWEGTAHTVIAKQIMGENAEAKSFLLELRSAQGLAPNANNKGIVATCHDGVTTGIAGFLLFNRLHVAATAWYTLAERRFNPYWGIRTRDRIPHENR